MTTPAVYSLTHEQPRLQSPEILSTCRDYRLTLCIVIPPPQPFLSLHLHSYTKAWLTFTRIVGLHAEIVLYKTKFQASNIPCSKSRLQPSFTAELPYFTTADLSLFPHFRSRIGLSNASLQINRMAPYTAARLFHRSVPPFIITPCLINDVTSMCTTEVSDKNRNLKATKSNSKGIKRGKIMLDKDSLFKFLCWVERQERVPPKPPAPSTTTPWECDSVAKENKKSLCEDQTESLLRIKQHYSFSRHKGQQSNM